MEVLNNIDRIKELILEQLPPKQKERRLPDKQEKRLPDPQKKTEEPKKPEEKTVTQPDPTMKDPTDYNIDITPKKEVPSGTEIRTPQTPPNNVQSGIPKRGRVIKLIHPNDW